MTFLDDKTQTEIKKILESIHTPLEVVLYTASPLVIPGQDAPGLQDETRGLLRELTALSDRISLVERPLSSDPEAQAAGIRLAPTIVLREAGSYRTNIRFVGLPSGYEFRTLLEALLMLGSGQTDLGERVKSELEKVTRPIVMQAFVTPGCPYCPKAVLTAFKFAFHNPNVVAEGIEANEFPTLSQRHRISSVPDTIITAQVNGKPTSTRVLGAQPERAFVEAALQTAGVAA